MNEPWPLGGVVKLFGQYGPLEAAKKMPQFVAPSQKEFEWPEGLLHLGDSHPTHVEQSGVQ